MQISDILVPSRIQCGIQCRSKKQAFDIAAQALSEHNDAALQEKFYSCLLKRERLGSTGLGQGVAIPHGKLPDFQQTIACVLKLKHGINYEAVDGQAVDIMFAMVVPECATTEHLETLRYIAKIFSQSEIINSIRKAQDSQQIYSLLTRSAAPA